MQIKTNHHDSIVLNYFFAKGKEREHYKRGSNLFFEGDTLYSFGYHFVLAVKCRNGHVLNGDTYSHATNGHQSLTRDTAENHSFITSHGVTKKEIIEKAKEKNTNSGCGWRDYYGQSIVQATEELKRKHSYSGWDDKKGKCKPTPKEKCTICQAIPDGHLSTHHCIIPFSSLEGAGIKPEDVFILDVTEDTYETIKRKNPKTGEMEEQNIHHLGASLIRVGTKRYLSSIDTGASNGRSQFYLVELKSRRVNTVEDAFRNLAGTLTDEQYNKYQLGDIMRQGEYFLEPWPELKTRNLNKKARKTKIRKEVVGVLDVRVKTSVVKKKCIAPTIKLSNQNCGGFGREQVRVIKRDEVPYYVLLDRDHTGMKIPEDAIVDGRSLIVEMESAVQHGYDLSQGVGNPHIATDAILCGRDTFIRKTLRHTEHKMLRLGNIWGKVYKNTAMGSWTAVGGVD